MRVCEHRVPSRYVGTIANSSRSVYRCTDCDALILFVHGGGVEALADGVVMVEKLPDGRYKSEAWCPCLCGKVRHEEYWSDSEEVARKYMDLMVMSASCKVCSAEAMRLVNVCPERGCTREGYAHTGRCQPSWIPPEVRADLLARSADTNRSAGRP